MQINFDFFFKKNQKPTTNSDPRQLPRVDAPDVERARRLPSASAASWWCKLGARGGVSALQRPRSPGGDPGISDTGAFYPEHNFFAGQQNPKPDVAALHPGAGFSGRHPPPPLLPKSHSSGRLPSVELGLRPPGGTSRFCEQRLPWTSTSRRGRRGDAAGKGPLSQHRTFPVSALGGHARSHPTSSQRETSSSDNTDPHFLCL